MIVGAAVLAVVWVALTGDASPGGAGFGLALGLVALRLSRPPAGQGLARVRLRRLPGFLLYVGWEVLLANVRLVRVVLAPLARLRPVIVAVPLTVDREAEVAMLANLITLTPGTLTLKVTADRRTLYVHALGVDDPEALRREIREGFERRILEVFR